MFRCFLLLILVTAGCSQGQGPCEHLCMSALVEYEPGYEPAMR